MFVRRAGPDHHLKFAGFDNETHLGIVEAQMFGRQRELDAALLSRSKREALETFQFLDWARHTSRYVSDVELHDFIARAFACVLDLNAHDKPTVRSYARRAELQIR